LPSLDQLLGPQRLIGRSTASRGKCIRAIQEGANYIGGQLPNLQENAAAGRLCPLPPSILSIPWFAIRGIDVNNT